MTINIGAYLKVQMMTYLIYSVSFNTDVTKVKTDVEQEYKMTKIAIVSQKLLRDVIII